MLSPEWRFLKTLFSCRLNGELCQRRRRRQRKRHCLKDFSVGRDYSNWRKISVKCKWISLELNCWGPSPSLEGEREICSLVFTSSIKRHLREFHVAVVQWRQRNFVQKSVLHVQSCCFVAVFCCRSRCHRHRRAKAPSWMDENGSFWEK